MAEYSKHMILVVIVIVIQLMGLSASYQIDLTNGSNQETLIALCRVNGKPVRSQMTLVPSFKDSFEAEADGGGRTVVVAECEMSLGDNKGTFKLLDSGKDYETEKWCPNGECDWTVDEQGLSVLLNFSHLHLQYNW